MKYESINQKESEFNGVYSRNVTQIKDVINLHVFISIGTHLIMWYVNAENVTYFGNFGVEDIPRKNRKFN